MVNLVPFLPIWNFVWPLLIFVGPPSKLYKSWKHLESVYYRKSLPPRRSMPNYPEPKFRGPKRTKGARVNHQTIPVFCQTMHQTMQKIENQNWKLSPQNNIFHGHLQNIWSITIESIIFKLPASLPSWATHSPRWKSAHVHHLGDQQGQGLLLA